MSVTWAGQSTSVNLSTTSSVGTGATGTPVGPAGGDLAGSYPNPTVDGLQGRPVASTAPTTGEGLIWSGTEWASAPITASIPDGDKGDITVSGSGATWTIDPDSVSYAKMQNVSATDRLLGRSSAGAGDVEEIVCTAYARGLLDDADAATARTTLGLGTTDTPTFAGINLSNGEFISNALNGRVDIGPNGIDPASPAQDYMALTIDGTWGFGVILGTRNTRTNALNTGNALFNVPCILNNDTRFSFGSSQNYFIRHVSGSSRAGLACGLLVNNAGSTGSLVLVQGNEVTAANRIPTTAHTDPTLYLYGRGSTNAAHYMRLSHDTANGTIETGSGDLLLKAAGATKIEGTAYGYTLPTSTGLFGQMPERGTGATTRWAYPRNPRNGFALQTDGNTVGEYTALQGGTGAATSFTIASTTTRFGIASSTTGTTATGRAGLGSAAVTQVVFGQGYCEFEAAVAVPTLSSATETFVVQAGWCDSLTAASVDSVEVQYTDAAGTGDSWDCVTRSNGTETRTAVGSNLVAGQFYILKITVDAAGTEVKFYLDDVLVATHTTNIPTGTARATGALVQIRKTVGTTARTLNNDYIWHWHGLTR